MKANLLWSSFLLLALFLSADGRKRKHETHFRSKLLKRAGEMMLADDPLFTVEEIPPSGLKIGTCECHCCPPTRPRQYLITLLLLPSFASFIAD